MLCLCEGSSCFVLFYILKFLNKMLKGNDAVEAFGPWSQCAPVVCLGTAGCGNRSAFAPVNFLVSTKTPRKCWKMLGRPFLGLHFFHSLVEKLWVLFCVWTTFSCVNLFLLSLETGFETATTITFYSSNI